MLAQDSIALKSRTKSDLDPRPNLIWDQGQTPLGTRTKPHLGPGPTHAREQEWIPPPWSNHAWDQHQTAPGSKTQPHLSPAPNRTWVQDLTRPEPSTKPHLCPRPDPTQAQLQTTPGYQDLTRPRSRIESHLGSDQITIGMCHTPRTKRSKKEKGTWNWNTYLFLKGKVTNYSSLRLGDYLEM